MTDQELLARASAAIRLWSADAALAYADLATARAQLGLPEDADVAETRKQRLLFSFAGRPLFRWGAKDDLGPLGEMLDVGQIEAAVGTSFALSGPLADQVSPENVVVVHTRQPFEEIAERLRGEGYEEAADGLLLGEPIDPDACCWTAWAYPGDPFPAVGAGGRGILVFGGSEEAARAALGGEGAELTPAAKLIDELRGVLRLAAGEPWLQSRCAVAFGFGEDAAPREGELRIVVEGEARAERLLFGGPHGRSFKSFAGEVTFAAPTTEDGTASVRFSSTDDLNATRLPLENVQQPYECP